MKVTPISSEENPFFPLPPDYPELTKEGQRQARVNASRLWTLKGTPKQKAMWLVASTNFFDNWYLQPDEEANFDPGFYDGEVLTTPEIHWDMSRMWAMYRLSLIIAPRGCAKSTHGRKDSAMRVITVPRYSIVYASSTHDNAKFTGQIIRDQAYENSRVQDDFCPEYDCDTLKPAKGAKMQGVEHFYLNNGSWLRCVSVESRLRGLRPRRFRLDDPEFDSKASTSMALIRQYMDTLLFKVAIPMVLRRGSGLDWTSTLVSKRHFSWHAMQTVLTEAGMEAADPRFQYWSTLLLKVATMNEETGQLESCWPEMWPETIEKKREMGAEEAISIEEMPRIMGQSAFLSEMMGEPGSAEDQFFKLDLDPKGNHAWWLEDVQPDFLSNPVKSATKICWKDQHGDTRRAPLGDFVRSARLFMAVDTAYTESAHSDRRVANLMAITPENELFVLDLWSGRQSDATLIQKALELGGRWLCPSIHVEVVRESFKLYQRFRSVVSTKLNNQMGFDWTPAIKEMRPGTIEKTSKIEALDLRFELNLIKLPLWMRASNPGVTRLVDQVIGFNPEAEGGGLQHDDELDTVAMSLFIVKGRLPRVLEPTEKDEWNAMQRLEDGHLDLPDGTPIFHGIALEHAPPEVIRRAFEIASAEVNSPSGGTRV